MTNPSQQDPVTPEILLNFLSGEGPLEGVWFGEKPTGAAAYWWRKYLPVLTPNPDLSTPTDGGHEAEGRGECDLTKCPNCGGAADNGHDRCDPPSPYYCTKCERQEDEEVSVDEMIANFETTPTTPPPSPDRARCDVCEWPLAKSVAEGCVNGNCSYRPHEGTEEFIRIEQRRKALSAPQPVAGALPPTDCSEDELLAWLHENGTLVDWKRETDDPLSEFEAICAEYDKSRGLIPGKEMAKIMRKVECMLVGWFGWHRERIRAALTPQPRGEE